MKAFHRSIAILIVAAGALSGCNDGTPFSGLDGKYTGVVTLASSAKSSVPSELASGVLTNDSDHQITLSLLGSDRATWTFTASWDDSGSIQWTESGSNAVSLKQDADGCFSESSDPQGFHLCINADEISLENRHGASTLATFLIQKDNPAASITLEEPATYTFQQLLDRVKNQNFGTRIQFERYVAAKLGAENAALNLLPHFSTNTVLNILSLSWLTILKSVGDIAPFLFPDKWLDAKASQWESKAHQQAWLAMRADATQIVEGLAYSIMRDQVALDRLAVNRNETLQVRDLIVTREHAGLMQVGSSDDITAILLSIDQASAVLKQGLSGEFSALAQAVGFNNPLAIASIEGIPDELPEGVELPDITGTITQVVANSLELRQMQDLVEAANLESDARPFTFLDPNGPQAGNMGFGYGDFLEIGASNVREVELKRDQLRSLLAQKTSDAIDQYGEVLQSYDLGKQGIGIQTRRVDRLTENLRMGITFSMSDLVSALQGLTQADLQRTNAQYNAMIAQSRLSRLTLQGIYHPLATP